MLKNGKDKPLNTQARILKEILLKSDKLRIILECLSQSGLTNYYVAAGAVNQTVFNYYHGYPSSYGIEDVDVVYFDKDLSYEKEDEVIKRLNSMLKDVDVRLDIKNQARVHLWYEGKFGHKIEANQSVEDAIKRWGTTVTCLGVRLVGNKLIVYAPYGLNDLFAMCLRLVKLNMTKKNYEQKTKKWQRKWPLLNVIPWEN